MTKLISIEGNIGSGKSTLVNKLKEFYKGNDNVYFLDEPVNEWVKIKDEEGTDILSKFYGDTKEYAFSFQMMAYITRVHLLRKALKENPNRIFITERSILTDKEVFAKMLYDDGMIEKIKYDIYLRWFDEFSSIQDMDIIYVKTNPEICNERIKKRNRPGEDIELSYLKRCNEYHEVWLKDKCRMVLDGNEDKLDNQSYQKWLSMIDNYIGLK